MWLHTIADYTGNFGIGLSTVPIFGECGEGENDFHYNATYLAIPIQCQYVGKNGLTFAAILTPAFALEQELSDDNFTIDTEYDPEMFSNFRLGLHGEFGYNYKRWDFGLRFGMWYCSYIANYTTVTYDLSFTIGYRIKLN